MTSSRPYLIRAIYDWLLDNKLTPYILVDVTLEDVSVPQQFVKDGKIILNIAEAAVSNLSMSNRAIEFNARFSGIPHQIYIPVMAVQAIYSYENGRGMVFNEDDEDSGPGDEPPDDNTPSSKKGRAHLRVIK